jgi:RHS repeat-associated protein
VDILFAFTGRDRDEETGLQYHRARYYDPTPGRWLSEDPIGFEAGDTHLDRYIENNPLNYVDPSGLEGVGTIHHVYPLYRRGGTKGGGSKMAQIGALGAACALGAQADSPFPGPADAIAAGVFGIGVIIILASSEQLKLLTEWEIQKLKEAGYDPHDLKADWGGKGDLYKDQHGNIKIKPKGGGGEGEDIGININDVLGKLKRSGGGSARGTGRP